MIRRPPRSTLFPYNDALPIYRLPPRAPTLAPACAGSPATLPTSKRPARPPPESSKTGSAPRKSRSEEHTSELQSPHHLVCPLLLQQKKNTQQHYLSPDRPSNI